MNFPDVEVLVIGFLESRITPVPVKGKVPNPRPVKFVRVWRTGGAAQNRVLERVTLTVQAWAEGEAGDADAFTLARQAREHLLNDYTAMPLVRGVEEITGPYFDPDPDTGVDRYSFSMKLSVRAAR